MINKQGLKDLEQKFAEKYGKNYSRDGITNSDEYAKSKVKILWVLKEANSIDRSGVNLIEFHKNVACYSKWRRTYARIIKASYAILNDIFEYDKIPNESEIINTMHKIAFINIKKSAGGSRSYSKEINKYFNDDKELLLEQIKYIAPNVIINTSGVALSKSLEANTFDGIVINTYHPNATCINHLQYFDNIMHHIVG